VPKRFANGGVDAVVLQLLGRKTRRCYRTAVEVVTTNVPVEAPLKSRLEPPTDFAVRWLETWWSNAADGGIALLPPVQLNSTLYAEGRAI